MPFSDGVININKPAGWTSQDVCAKLRGILHIKKIGHTGTLDPMATGVLPVCTGKATRIIEYYDLDMKTYRAAMKLGVTTDTLDIWGDVLSDKIVRILDDTNAGESCSDQAAANDYTEIHLSKIVRAFDSYRGHVSQIPPKYSALKINGRRAYDLAREGMEFEIKSREVYIPENRVLSVDTNSGIIEFEVTCSKGTYIRTICDDIGRALGCRAAMTSLERTGSGCFRVEEAVSIEELAEMGPEEIEARIIPMDETLERLGIITLYDNRITAFMNGNPSDIGFKILKKSEFSTDNSLIYKVYGNSGGDQVFLGTGSIRNGTETLIPAKVIYRR